MGREERCRPLKLSLVEFEGGVKEWGSTSKSGWMQSGAWVEGQWSEPESGLG